TEAAIGDLPSTAWSKSFLGRGRRLRNRDSGICSAGRFRRGRRCGSSDISGQLHTRRTGWGCRSQAYSDKRVLDVSELQTTEHSSLLPSVRRRSENIQAVPNSIGIYLKFAILPERHPPSARNSTRMCAPFQTEVARPHRR